MLHTAGHGCFTPVDLVSKCIACHTLCIGCNFYTPQLRSTDSQDASADPPRPSPFTVLNNMQGVAKKYASIRAEQAIPRVLLIQ